TQGALTGVATGFTDLDRLTAGFQRGDLVIVAARPSMGKTALALNVVQHAAIEHNVGIADFALRMSKEQPVQRLLCSEGLVDAQRLRRGQLRDDDYPKLARAAGLLGTAPIWIDDSAMLSPLAMRSKARRLKAEHDIGLVVVDYLQMMQGPTDSESRQQEIWFIYRQEFYDGPIDPKTNESIEGIAELIVGKQRNGPTGTVRLFFKKEYTRFDNYTPREAPTEAARG